MGTSVSHRSPPTIGWKSISACYSSPDAPLDRTATEIWRAAFQQDESLRTQLGSQVVADCIKAASESLPREEVKQRVKEISATKQNSVVGEFAKRAFLLKAGGAFEGETPTAVLFRQLTDYYISRDIPGYVGPSYRCKTVAELRELKKSIGDVVAQKVNTAQRQLSLSGKPWAEVFPVILQRLQEQ
jgi:hypothetical protein